MKQYLEKRGIYITWSQLAVRIIFDLVGFLLALLPAGLTLYLTDVWITSGTHMPTSWILGIIVCVFLIHFYQFYFVNYNSQMNADRMAGNYRQHLAQKILSSSIPAYESQNKARIQNMANDVSAIYTVSSYLVTVPANLVKVIIIIGLLLFYASPSVALTAIILIPLYMVPSFLNKSELERLVAEEREAGDLWFQEFDVILNGKVSITLNKVENYMQNRYNEALKSYVAHEANLCFKLPDNVSTMEGALIEPLAVGFHAANQGGAHAGQTAVVMGAGCIGLVSMMALKAEGVSRVYVVDIMQKRLDKALELGADGVINSREKDAVQTILDLTDGLGCDLVIETAGTEITTRQAIEMAQKGANIVLVGYSKSGEMTLPMSLALDKELTFKTVFRYRHIYPMAIDAVASGKINLKGIVTNIFDFDDIQNAMDKSISDKANIVKAVVKIAEETKV